MKMLQSRSMPERIIKSILDVVNEKSKVEFTSVTMKRTSKLENLMIRTYISEPAINYGVCRQRVQPFALEYHLDDGVIRRRAEFTKLTERVTRTALAKWAYSVVELIYEGMSGDEEAIKKAATMIEGKYSEKDKYHYAQEQFVLFGMFEFIPELRDKPQRDDLLKLGRKFSIFCLKKIINSITYDVMESNGDPEVEKMTDVAELRREVYLARKELQDYRKLVEAADADFDNKLEELKQQEIASFFSALNNEKYGFLIDSLFLLVKGIKSNKEKLPYSLEGIPAFMNRFCTFLHDVHIAPVSSYPPSSVQRLTLEEMTGCRFEPLPDRPPIKEGEKIVVKVISSGWKLGDTVISYPVLQEEYND